MRTVFLDFDGVLHPEFCHESKHLTCLPVFEQVLREVTECDVVIASTWRLKMSLDSLRDRFSPDLAERVIGVTGQFEQLVGIPDSLISFPREAECFAWLREHDRVVFPWLAVDDRSWLYRPFSRSLYLVDGRTGLTGAAAQELVKRLRRL